jgi:hypothetical protein
MRPIFFQGRVRDTHMDAAAGGAADQYGSRVRGWHARLGASKHARPREKNRGNLCLYFSCISSSVFFIVFYFSSSSLHRSKAPCWPCCPSATPLSNPTCRLSEKREASDPKTRAEFFLKKRIDPILIICKQPQASNQTRVNLIVVFFFSFFFFFVFFVFVFGQGNVDTPAAGTWRGVGRADGGAHPRARASAPD